MLLYSKPDMSTVVELAGGALSTFKYIATRSLSFRESV